MHRVYMHLLAQRSCTQLTAVRSFFYDRTTILQYAPFGMKYNSMLDHNVGYIEIVAGEGQFCVDAVLFKVEFELQGERLVVERGGADKRV